MRATRLLIICHGATDATVMGRFPNDEPLLSGTTPPALQPPRGAKVLCGPERRARESALLLGLAATVDQSLRDCDFGRWGGRTLGEVAGAWPTELAQWISSAETAPDGGESFGSVRDRTTVWLAARAAEGGAFVAVTGPTVTRAAVAHVLGLSTSSNAAEIDVEPFATVALTHDGHRWHLRFRSQNPGHDL